MSVEEVVEVLANSIALLPQKIKIVLTVSPVRHTRDTLQVNSISKAVLRVACSQLVEQYPKQVSYFPSYEVMLDELRDYRFYEADLIHPNTLAKEILFDRFAGAYFSAACGAKCKELVAINSMHAHRVSEALAPSREYQDHLRRLKTKMLIHEELYHEELQEVERKLKV
jgi:hypothetical protein